MRLVWVVIPLILFGIIGIQESFAEQASGKSAWVTNSDKVCGDRLCSEIPYSQKETSKIESPKKQMQKGIHALDVMCKENLELVIRINGFAVCVKSETAEKMQKAGMLFIPIEFTKSEKEIETIPASSMSIVNFYITDHDLNLAHNGIEVVSTEGLFEFTVNGVPIEGPENMIETGPNTSTFEVQIKIPREIDGKTIHIGDWYEIRYIDRSTPSNTDEKIILKGKIG